MARQFAEEEAGHVGYVRAWLSGEPAELDALPEDDDPPHMPQ